MRSYIALTRKWADEHVVEILIEVSGGSSVFVNSAYVEHEWFARSHSALKTFSRQVHGGLYDLEAGGFGPEFGGGALHARFHYYRPNLLYISTHQEGEFVEFKRTWVAAEAKLFLRTEPGLVDSFIAGLPILERAEGERVILECIALQ